MSLTSAQEVEYKEAFALFDPTNSGKIQPEAFRSFLNTLGDQKLIADVKVPTQALDFKAFCSLMSQKHKGLQSADAANNALFRAINTEGNGNISAAELKAAADKFIGKDALSAADIDEVIHEADVSGDGRISLEELLKVLEKSAKKLRGEHVL